MPVAEHLNSGNKVAPYTAQPRLAQRACMLQTGEAMDQDMSEKVSLA
jgi:hypothetical protein